MARTKAKPLPSVAELLALFDYHPSNGALHWRSGPRSGKRAGYLDGRGYRQVRIRGDLIYAHRIVWKIETGDEPEQIDHRNGAGDDSFDNLRAANNQGNSCNKLLTQANTSGYKGVSWHKQAKKWVAEITVNYKKKYLGLFDDAAESHAAYLVEARRLHGKFHNPGARDD